ncbi:MAG: hypothetical protein MRY21_00310 [Simkaniaceae bacterium]|nr:hypothetical protein [Simkaniaceae bacterium]
MDSVQRNAYKDFEILEKASYSKDPLESLALFSQVSPRNAAEAFSFLLIINDLATKVVSTPSGSIQQVYENLENKAVDYLSLNKEKINTKFVATLVKLQTLFMDSASIEVHRPGPRAGAGGPVPVRPRRYRLCPPKALLDMALPLDYRK